MADLIGTLVIIGVVLLVVAAFFGANLPEVEEDEDPSHG